MITDTDTIRKFRRFLDRLRQGDFADELPKAFAQLNSFISDNPVAQAYFRDEYIPELYADARSGQQQISFLVGKAIESLTPSLAYTLTEALINLYTQTENEEILGSMLELMLRYGFTDFFSVEITGQNLRMESRAANFSLRIDAIRRNVRLSLLQLLLKKYSNALLAETLPNQQDLPSVLQRLNHVLLLLFKFDDKAEMERHTTLLPFAILDDLSYSPASASLLFSAELDALAYDERLLYMYRIPLFPVIETDTLDFTGSKLCFTNEGKGCLPTATIRIHAAGDEFEIGELGHTVGPSESSELFVEEGSAFADFLRSHNPNADIKVIFSFRKFAHSYDFAVFAQSAGSWLEKIPRNIVDVALSYAVPLNMLSDKEFERLCYWIVAEYPDNRFETVTWLNEDGGGERGRDVLATEVDTGRKYVFQCKRVEKFHPSDVEEELTKFAHYVLEDPSIRPDVYVLFLSSQITDQAKARGDKLAHEIGMEIEYWPKGTIDRLVRTNQNVKERFWKVVNEI
jgi:hypothetical protein